MEFDVFTLIERVFAAVIQFITSLATSVWVLVRHPYSGPRLLWRRYRSAAVRQIGPNTLLVILLLPGQIVASGLTDNLIEQLRNSVNEFQISEDFLPPLIAALLIAFLIDAGLRMVHRLRHPRTASDRVAAGKFRICALLLYGTLGMALYIVAILLSMENVLLLVIVALAFPIVVPIGFHYAVRRRRRDLSRALVRGAGAILLAGVLGAITMSRIEALTGPMPFARFHGRLRAITVAHLSCRIVPGPELHVDVVLHNQTQGTRTIAAAATATVRLFGNSEPLELKLRARDAAAPFYMIVEPHHHAALALTTAASKEFAAAMARLPKDTTLDEPALCDANGGNSRVTDTNWTTSK